MAIGTLSIDVMQCNAIDRYATAVILGWQLMYPASQTSNWMILEDYDRRTTSHPIETYQANRISITK